MGEAMGEAFAPKQKTEASLDIRIGSKIYVAKYESIPKKEELPTLPKSKKPEKVDEFFATFAKEYNVAIYKEDGTKVESPSDKMLAKAGKALFNKAMTQKAPEEIPKTYEKIFSVPKKV